MEKYLKAVREMYLKAVREMYSWFKKINAHPMEKYIGRHVAYRGRVLEVVGYSGSFSLIVDASKCAGWKRLNYTDVVIKKCERYWYVSVSNLID